MKWYLSDISDARIEILSLDPKVIFKDNESENQFHIIV